MKDAIATRSDYIFTPPILIQVCSDILFLYRLTHCHAQIWAKIPDYVRYMASIDGIVRIPLVFLVLQLYTYTDILRGPCTGPHR